MTRIPVNKAAVIKSALTTAGRQLLQLSLLCSLVAVVGCEGSQLGNSLGESLEPDPQLAENASTPSTDDDADSAESPQPQSSTNRNRETESPNRTASPSDDDADAAAEEAPEEEAPPAVIAGDYRDIDKAPEEIQAYLVDLIELDLLEVRPPASPPPAADDDDDDAASTPAAPATDEFRPNQAMTRREYARWLLAVNNRFYEGERTRKIRPGVDSSQPVFQDVPVTDPDFAAIQGLAEAGIIPSPLTGSSTTVTFRPNAPLTRKDLLLWKVPLDTRQALPEATASAVQQAWGFQDAGKIEPRALQAVLADYQNGDFANIRRAFSYTTLFQPDKAATRAEGAAVLWRFGNSTEGITAAEIRSPNGGNPQARDSEASQEE